MADADRDQVLKEMAANRGCKLTKSRRRKPGGDFGRYGLKDAKTGAEVFGFGENGLTAAAEDIEAYLRGSTVATWKRSLIAAVDEMEPAPSPPKTVARAQTRKAAPPSPPAPRVARQPKRERVAPAPPPLSIREAKPADAAAIAELLAAVGSQPTHADVAANLKLLRSMGEPPLVATQGGVVGCASWHATPELHQPDPVGRIPIIVVAEDARKRGIGKALLEAVEARLRERGCTSLEVTSSLALSGALAFYQACGFERSGFHLARRIPGNAEDRRA